MKKKIFALMCALAMLLAALPAASAVSSSQTRAADTLYTLGLIQGSDSYRLDEGATRAAAVSLLVRISGHSGEVSTKWSGFSDVPAGIANAVNYACAQGWVQGLSTTTFGSARSVTANGYAAFVLRMLGYTESSGDFTVSGAMLFARHIGLFTSDFNGALTRGELFELTVEALGFPYKNSGDTVMSNLVARGAVASSAANALNLLPAKLTARQAADRCSAAVFLLDTYSSQLYVDAATPTGAASGFFISSDGLAVTNYHSIKGDIRAVATLSTGEQYAVERVLYYDPDIDIAVIRVSMTSLKGVATSRFASLEMAGSDGVGAGDTVYAIGNPLGLGLAISAGVVSDPSRVLDTYKYPCIMHTADISEGSSGGALLNEYGQVIGVTCGAYVYGNSMYLAVPVDPVMSADLTGTGWTLSEVAQKQAALDAAGKAA
jgi:Trypsin-like serine proteases, typically periplasmic, contain C-terminal PDZ domain